VFSREERLVQERHLMEKVRLKNMASAKEQQEILRRLIFLSRRDYTYSLEDSLTNDPSHTYLHRYLHAYIHTYIHTYIHI
jgi:hypothetical protein